MSKRESLTLDRKIMDILASVNYAAPKHHLGRPFLTAYQIAIELAIHHPGDVAAIGFPIGGKGTREHNSLAQYLARQLSRRIGKGKLPNVEGGFLSNRQLRTITFSFGKNTIESSIDRGAWRLRSTNSTK